MGWPKNFGLRRKENLPARAKAFQLINDSREDLVLYVVADNPIGESVHYHDSKKWMVRSPERRVFCGEPLEHYDGEE